MSAWILESRLIPKDRWVVDAGRFETEVEAARHAGKDERPRFDRELVRVPVFVCENPDCKREHVADLADFKTDEETGALVLDEAGVPILIGNEPEPCEHTSGERVKGPKQPWE